MKKRLLALALSISSLLCSNVPDSTEELMFASFSPPTTEQIVTISPATQTILHIFYTTQRLLPITTFIKTMASRSKQKEEMCIQRLIFFFSETNLLKSSKMQTVFSHIKQSNSLEPLYRTWERLNHFRYGIHASENSILLDFAKICLVAYQAILSCSSSHKNIPGMVTLTPEDLDLFEIEQVFEILESYSVLYSLRYSPLALIAVQKSLDFKRQPSSFCASFSLRYYLKKRLQTSFALFKSLQSRHVPIFLYGIEHLGFKKEDLIFNDPVITAYFSLLLEEKQLGSLMQLIEQFQGFDFIKSPIFTKEFLILLALVYKDIFTLRSTETFDELQELSIEQILSLIDMVNEKYGTHSISSRVQLDAFTPLSIPKNNVPLRSIDALIEREYGITSDTFTDMVFHRYYYVKRLEDVTKILLNFTYRRQPLTKNRTSLFLKPLALVWEDFKAYRDLCNQKIITDLTKEIFVLLHTILHAPANQSHQTILHAFLPSHTNGPSKISKTLTNEQNFLFHDFRPWIEIDKVLNRFYLLRRMDPIFHKLHLLNTQGLLHLGCNNSTHNEIDPCLEQLHLTKEPILTLIRELYGTRSFHPLFTFWKNLNRYKYIQDEEIIREFARLVTHLLHRTATHYAFHLRFPSYGNDPERLPYQLQQMPLEDILNLLDILADELPEFLEKNEIRPGMDWKEWLKKYWLIFPFSTAIFAIKIYMMSHNIGEAANHPHLPPNASQATT